MKWLRKFLFGSTVTKAEMAAYRKERASCPCLNGGPPSSCRYRDNAVQIGYNEKRGGSQWEIADCQGRRIY